MSVASTLTLSCIRRLMRVIAGTLSANPTIPALVRSPSNSQNTSSPALPPRQRGSKMSGAVLACNFCHLEGFNIMLRWFYILPHLMLEAGTARRDARVRFLKAQVDILRRKLGGNRVVPTPDDRLRLLALGAELDHNVSSIIGIVTPRTYARWVVEQREGRKVGRVGRPKVARDLKALVRRLARENSGWGYRRIAGELRKLRLRLGRTSIRRILREAGLTPSPHRRSRAEETVWRKFIRLHVNTLVACDFFTKSVVTPVGTRLAFVLAFIHVGTRKVFLSPSTYHPDETGIGQQARNVMMWLDDQNLQARFILHDPVLIRVIGGWR